MVVEKRCHVWFKTQTLEDAIRIANTSSIDKVMLGEPDAALSQQLNVNGMPADSGGVVV